MENLWKHQEFALKKYRDRQFFGLLFACGLGKTRTAIAIAEEKEMPVLVIAPAVLCKERLFAVVEARDVRAVLFGCAAAQIHPPHRKPDSLGIAVRADFPRKQPLGDLPLLRFVEILPNEIAAPCVGCGKVVDSLAGFRRIDFYVDRKCGQRRKRENSDSSPTFNSVFQCHTGRTTTHYNRTDKAKNKKLYWTVEQTV